MPPKANESEVESEKSKSSKSRGQPKIVEQFDQIDQAFSQFMIEESFNLTSLDGQPRGEIEQVVG